MLDLPTQEDARGGALSTGRPRIVAVDGPAGSGKSSLCFAVAKSIGWTYVNTGALYRAVGLLAQDEGLDLDDAEGIAQMVTMKSPDFTWDAAKRSLACAGQDLTHRLESEAAGYGASKIARLGQVRRELLPLQRAMTLAAKVGALVDGRDIGTVVFPDADLKVFLTASLEARSRRRLDQLGSGAPTSGLEEIREGLARRDERDGRRDVAPLKQASDAVVLDTSDLTFDESVAAIISLLSERGLLK